jgi:two-component system, NtrC family, sensor kinase
MTGRSEVTSRILIVDDSLTVRMDLAEAFETGGMQPMPCASVGAARQALDTDDVDAIILDVHLPDGDGVDLLRDLRTDPRHGTTPVLMLSSEAEVKDRVRGLRGGADEYVGKPYDAGYVVARTRELLGARTGPGATTVLLIDDSRTLRAELRRTLQADGYAVVTAATGEDGLRIAADRRPGIIIVDAILPGIDGATVIRRIRLDAALRDVPCVLLTGSTDRHLELDVLDAGADAFVRKDEDRTVLLAKVAAILRHNGSRDPAPSASLHGPKKILAVDADLHYLTDLTACLREDGYEVVQAHTGEDAIELLATQPVDCILLDPNLPALSGADTCQRIKAAPVVRDIPLIVLGRSADAAAVLAGLGDGADDYAVKSDRFDVLRARVRAQLRRKHVQDDTRRAHQHRLRQELESAEARAALELARTRAALIRELEWKNNELEAFSYSVSHDLRNPLNVVDGYSQAILDDYAHILGDTAIEYLHTIRIATARMTELIESLLRLSHAGQADITRDTVDLTVAARQTVDALRLREPERRIDVSVADGLLASADAHLIRIVLDNLIGNAWKYTRHVETPRVEVASHRVDDEIVFYVRDNGAGFHMEHAEHVFRPYRRLHDAHDYPGTGIGLATVFRVIDRHGGRIWAEGEVGAGATFHFTTGPPGTA